MEIVFLPFPANRTALDSRQKIWRKTTGDGTRLNSPRVDTSHLAPPQTTPATMQPVPQVEHPMHQRLQTLHRIPHRLSWELADFPSIPASVQVPPRLLMSKDLRQFGVSPFCFFLAGVTMEVTCMPNDRGLLCDSTRCVQREHAARLARTGFNGRCCCSMIIGV